MDSLLYQHISEFIKANTIPVDVTEDKRKEIIKYSKHYTLVNNLLFKKSGMKHLRVIKDSEVESLLFMLHSHPLGGHFGIDKVVRKIKEKYYWPQYVEDVKNYIKSCDHCQRRGKNLKSGELRPIPVGKPFEMIGIDF